MLTAKERISELADGFVDDGCYACDQLVPIAIFRRWQSKQWGSAWTLHCMNCGAEWTHNDTMEGRPATTEHHGLHAIDREWEDGGDDWDDFTPGRETP